MLGSVTKMHLVPANQLLQRINLNEKSSEAVESANVQFQMEKLLNNSKLPIDVKRKLVTNLLQQEQSLHNSAAMHSKSLPPIPINVPTTLAAYPPLSAPPSESDYSTASSSSAANGSPLGAPVAPQEPSTAPSSSAANGSPLGAPLARDIIASWLPKNHKERAGRLLSFIEPHMNWNHKGEIKDVGGNVLQGTNIADLVRYGLNTSRSAIGRGREPKGWPLFRAMLQTSNVPTALVPGVNEPPLPHAPPVRKTIVAQRKRKEPVMTPRVTRSGLTLPSGRAPAVALQKQRRLNWQAYDGTR